MSLSVRRRICGFAASAACSAIAFGGLAASQAQANVISFASCDSSALTQPFLPWLDSNSYKLVPGGDFEGPLSGWTLSGGAGVVAGSEPAGVTGTVGSSSLSLPAGAAAQSATTCVDAAYPTFRFFARTDTPGSLLAVSAVYNTLLGPTAVPVGLVALSTALVADGADADRVGGRRPARDGTAPLALRFTELTGTSQIDDVFVDPHTMH